MDASQEMSHEQTSHGREVIVVRVHGDPTDEFIRRELELRKALDNRSNTSEEQIAA